MRRVRPLALAVALAALAGAPSVHARAPARSVFVAVTGAGAEASRLEESVGELVARLGVRLAHDPAVEVLARVDLALDARSVRVTVTDPRDGALIVERVIDRDVSAALTREAVAHVVRAAVESQLIVDEAPPVVPDRPADAAPPVVPEPVAPRPSRDALPLASGRRTERPVGLGLDVLTLAGAGPFAAGAPVVPRFGLAGTLASRSGLRPALTLSLQYAVPFDVESRFVTARASPVLGRAIASIEVARRSRLSLEVGLGGGLDVLSVEPRSTVLPASRLRGPRGRLMPVVAASVTARLAIAPTLALTLAATSDLDLVSRDYVVAEGARLEDVLRPLRVRPALLLGLAFTAAGRPTLEPAVASLP